MAGRTERPSLECRQLQHPGGEAPLVADGQHLAGGVLNGGGGQGGVGAQQHGGVEGVLLEGRGRSKGGDGASLAVGREAPAAFDGDRGGAGGAGDQLVGADDLGGRRVSQGEGRVVQGGGIDGLIEGDDDRLAENDIGLVNVGLNAYELGLWSIRCISTYSFTESNPRAGFCLTRRARQE